MPYFHVISENKDWTINPTIYSKDIKLFKMNTDKKIKTHHL